MTLTGSLLLGCAYEAPFVDYGDYPETVVLSGDVVLTSGSASTQSIDSGGELLDRRVGHVLIYEADDLPPPNGFGSPIALATIGSNEWGAGSGERLGTYAEGVVSAPWGVTGLASGDYVVSALIDNDDDFNPFFTDFAGGATCGDQLGAYVLDAASGEILPLSVEAPDHVDGITILVGDPLPWERPAYGLGAMALETLPHRNLENNVFNVHDHEFDLDSTGISHPLLELEDPTAEDCPTTFTVIARDKDGDGVADPHPVEAAAGLGAIDMWPVVVMRHLLDEDGNPPEQATISQALIDFRPNPDDGGATPFQRALTHSDDWVLPAAMVPNAPYSSSRLPLLWTGTAVPVLEDGSYGEELVGDEVPTGTWGLVVINHTGQIWMTPNLLSSEELWGEAAIASQASVVGLLPE
ncbi:MAG TPA: hypothetical protein QGF58_11120 [Myxococcota bacterium]|nr:hypothetical protein [Myxococcota bacterium]